MSRAHLSRNHRNHRNHLGEPCARLKAVTVVYGGYAGNPQITTDATTVTTCNHLGVICDGRVISYIRAGSRYGGSVVTGPAA
jgi:hypothetical protein